MSYSWLYEQLATLEPSSVEWEELFAQYEEFDGYHIKCLEAFRQIVPLNEEFTLLQLRRRRFGDPLREVCVTKIYEMVKLGILRIVRKVSYGKTRQCNVYVRIV